MAQNKKKSHHATPAKTSVPASQRTSGHLLWALLMATFGVLIAFFAAGASTVALVAGALGGGIIGWVIGRKMEQAAGDR